jgi:exosome complex RNA-binding protein Rrp42 (RNase PH superfamily)
MIFKAETIHFYFVLVCFIGVVYVVDPLSDTEDVVNDLTIVSTDRDLHHLPFLVLINKRNGKKCLSVK